MARIESLLSARLFLVPQLVGDRIFFLSNLSGHLSLHSMKYGGGVPEPLLPPHIALQNPHLLEGRSFVVFPGLNQVLVMIDKDGDENYQPMIIPIDGGFPEPAFGDRFAGHNVFAIDDVLSRNLVYFLTEAREEALYSAYRADMKTRELTLLGASPYGSFPIGANEAHTKAALIDAYGPGDHVLYIKEDSEKERKLLYGTPLEKREKGTAYPPNSISDCRFVDDDRALVLRTSLFSDSYGLGYMELASPGAVKEVRVEGVAHTGVGELEGVDHIKDDRYTVGYNIDGCTWLYEGRFDSRSLTMTLESVLCGRGELSSGVLESTRYDLDSDRYVLSFTSATSPTQIYTIEGSGRDAIMRHTNERVLGLPVGALSEGEDASYTSHDGLRISARLYLPADSLGFEGPRPLVYYVHGGPQSQERPDFAWFSMPLIQFLTLSGFAVFVPNVRGSSGYGFEYMNRVARDWGGKDTLDHVHAMTKILTHDERIDTSRAGVVGRSYGGYMTLTLASRHPSLWSAAIDMFGPYELISFADRVPESWKPFMEFLMGDPVKDKDMLIERSPRTYIQDVTCPLLVIQGKNDPRVKEQESRELVEELRGMGKDVDYLMFEDEGHDVLKLTNRIRCYNAITDFFRQHLMPGEPSPTGNLQHAGAGQGRPQS